MAAEVVAGPPKPEVPPKPSPKKSAGRLKTWMQGHVVELASLAVAIIVGLFLVSKSKAGGGGIGLPSSLGGGSGGSGNPLGSTAAVPDPGVPPILPAPAAVPAAAVATVPAAAAATVLAAVKNVTGPNGIFYKYGAAPADPAPAPVLSTLDTLPKPGLVNHPMVQQPKPGNFYTKPLLQWKPIYRAPIGYAEPAITPSGDVGQIARRSGPS